MPLWRMRVEREILPKNFVLNTSYLGVQCFNMHKQTFVPLLRLLIKINYSKPMVNLSHNIKLFIKLLNTNYNIVFHYCFCPTQIAHAQNVTSVSMKNSYRETALMFLGKQVVKTPMVRIFYKVR
jgi:hypothetical protein